ncbi:MAG: hypothetical protein RLN81_12635 [Balneolaceae bacterium]
MSESRLERNRGKTMNDWILYKKKKAILVLMEIALKKAIKLIDIEIEKEESDRIVNENQFTIPGIFPMEYYTEPLR